ncbi:MAG: TIGR00701 family protein [Rickettsiales bacterium]|nr:TIGR00701 family protein [Rickettsiales bacterium]|tara:strand:+ start:68708 stop:69157 length:450 start_codon:yes stop_codon:yes gene_type:complete
MVDFITDHYLIIKSLHIIFVTFWMAGMFYLPRLYVYHATAKPGSELDLTLQVMERRLLKIIINPMIFLSIFFGLLLWFIPGVGLGSGVWSYLKLLLVFFLLAYHGFLSYCRKRFVHNQNTYTDRFFRLINEVPPIIFIVIVFLVVLKPF